MSLNQLVPSTTYNLRNDNGYFTSPLLSYALISFTTLAIATAQYGKHTNIQYYDTPCASGGPCPSRTSSTSAASPTSQSSSSIKHSTATTCTG